MVFVQLFHSNCYRQFYLVPSNVAALQCGVIEGLIVATLLSLLLGLIAYSISGDYPNIRNYYLVSVLVLYVTFIGVFGIGYARSWKKYQQLIQTFRSQGKSDSEIYILLSSNLTKSTKSKK